MLLTTYSEPNIGFDIYSCAVISDAQNILKLPCGDMHRWQSDSDADDIGSNAETLGYRSLQSSTFLKMKKVSEETFGLRHCH